ncbi:hypothetical protein WS67_07125 [Burkholderia singularis]|uniref:Uncharacterized protein n=1 Tax=Burkholderia singularis TaxID=1503053 RepID=A0A103E535_9BURK|nr:hypothetical protein WS67_07125 [Burkholderia singularis]
MPAQAGLSHRRLLSGWLTPVIARVMAEQSRGFGLDASCGWPLLTRRRERAPGLHVHIVRLRAAPD